MLTIKNVQDALKTKGVKFTQMTITSIVERLGISLNDMGESDLPKLVEDIIKASQSSLSTNTEGGNSKVTLGKLDKIKGEMSDYNLEDDNKNRNRSQANNSKLGDKLMQTADTIAQSNLEMAIALPKLVGHLTIKKLVENQDEINSLWDETNEQLTDIMFGL